MDKKLLFTYILIIGIALSFLNLNVYSSANDGGRGDANREYDCGNSCHRTRSESATIQMESSASSIMVNEEIVITVTVVSPEQKVSDPVGVFLVTALRSSESKPSDSGWTILEDPNGGTNNFVESTFDSGKSEFSWKLLAPGTPGKYSFFAREHHGNGNSFYSDYNIGMIIDVAGDHNTPPDSSDPVDEIINEDTKNVKSDNREQSELLISTEPDYMPIFLGFSVAALVVVVTHVMRRR